MAAGDGLSRERDAASTESAIETIKVKGVSFNMVKVKGGSLKQLLADYGRIAYARFDRETRCIVAVNNTGGWTDFRLFVRDAGAKDGEAFWRRIQTVQDGHTTEVDKIGTVSEGYLAFDLPPFSSVILSNLEK